MTGKHKWLYPFSHQELQTFNTLKNMLITPPVLAIPQFDKPFDVVTDASEFACGAVLLQEGRPVAYMSNRLSPAERNYPTHDRECLGIVSAYKEWSCNLEGLPCTPHPTTITAPHLTQTSKVVGIFGEFPPKRGYVQGRMNPADILSSHHQGVYLCRQTLARAQEAHLCHRLCYWWE